ncbi:ABC transporter ATP-binding protein [Streptomyces sp. GSL17-111]|uniref:ABC transporter ATP-binding protein n=1 Tax=Streptomyces sp. GSL17-111 TaxID=3121596 RepID=UPI0030F437EE
MKLTVEDLCVALGGRPVLHDVTLDAADREVVGLVGPNGSGKSTVLRAVYRSLRPERGAVRVCGDDVWRLSARQAACRTAAVLQDGTGNPVGLSVSEVVAMGRTPHHGLFGRDDAGDHRAVREALAACTAGHLAEREFASLSGGERQRVLLARALVQRPRLLVLDELTNHLDIRARFELLELVRSTGVTTLAVLHDLDLAVRLCDRVVVLHEGTVVASGPVLETLTTALLADVFGVAATVRRHDDGVIRVTYAADPLGAPAPAPVRDGLSA